MLLAYDKLYEEIEELECLSTNTNNSKETIHNLLVVNIDPKRNTDVHQIIPFKPNKTLPGFIV